MKNKKLLINIIKLLITFLIFILSDIFVLIPVKIFKLDINNLSTTVNYILTTFRYICLIIILFLLYRKDLKVEWKTFKTKITKNMDTAVKYYLIGVVSMMFFNIIINFVLQLGGPQNEKAVQNMISASPLLMLICAGFLAPITEELIFRKAFKNVFSNKWVFVIVSGIVFGAMHVVNYTFQNPLEVLYILPYGSLGACFAYMDYKVDSVFPSIAMHMIHNTALTIMSILI